MRQGKCLNETYGGYGRNCFTLLTFGEGELIENPITVAGIVIPSDDATFLTMVALHVVFALASVVTGLFAMLSNKGPGRHPTFGAIYYWCLTATWISATFVAVMRWADDYHLFVVGTLSFAAASYGRMAHRGRWHNWIRLHLTGMGTSYVLLLIAFYVDNGRNLPLWRDLPPIAYWLAPSVLGALLIVRAWLRHPLIRRSSAT